MFEQGSLGSSLLKRLEKLIEGSRRAAGLLFFSSGILSFSSFTTIGSNDDDELRVNGRVRALLVDGLIEEDWLADPVEDDVAGVSSFLLK